MMLDYVTLNTENGGRFFYNCILECQSEFKQFFFAIEMILFLKFQFCGTYNILCLKTFGDSS